MIDTMTRKRVTVDTDGEEEGGYLDIPLEQLDSVVALLEANAIPHWADEEALSMNGGPFEVVAQLDRTTKSPSFEGQIRAHGIALNHGMNALTAIRR